MTSEPTFPGFHFGVRTSNSPGTSQVFSARLGLQRNPPCGLSNCCVLSLYGERGYANCQVWQLSPYLSLETGLHSSALQVDMVNDRAHGKKREVHLSLSIQYILESALSYGYFLQLNIPSENSQESERCIEQDTEHRIKSKPSQQPCVFSGRDSSCGTSCGACGTQEALAQAVSEADHGLCVRFASEQQHNPYHVHGDCWQLLNFLSFFHSPTGPLMLREHLLRQNNDNQPELALNISHIPLGVMYD
ncbi:hypothetical protein STEG23_007549 [Scotinomys teguina]